jgi:hypothetical protein
VDGSRRSPGFASKDGETAVSNQHLAFTHAEFANAIRLLADGLPGISPSGRPRFSRLQLRGSAGIAPASLSSPQGKDAQTEGHFKEREIAVSEIYWLSTVEVNGWPGEQTLQVRL